MAASDQLDLSALLPHTAADHLPELSLTDLDLIPASLTSQHAAYVTPTPMTTPAQIGGHVTEILPVVDDVKEEEMTSLPPYPTTDVFYMTTGDPMSGSQYEMTGDQTTEIPQLTTGNPMTMTTGNQMSVSQYEMTGDPMSANMTTGDPVRDLLYASVRAECHQTSLPFLLLCPPPCPADTIPLSVRQASLEAQFLSAPPHLTGTHLTQLHAFYRHQTATLVAARRASLVSVHPAPPHLVQTVHDVFDFSLRELVTRVESSLGALHAAYQQHQPTPAPRGGKRRNPADRKQTAAGRAGGALSAVAVRIMTKWYSQNVDHAYPSAEAAQVMAEAGGITTEQVRKWFCNKRKRSGNTKTLSQIAARRHRGRQMSAESVLLAGTRAGRD